jgi:hypothetical protein
MAADVRPFPARDAVALAKASRNPKLDTLADICDNATNPDV